MLKAHDELNVEQRMAYEMGYRAAKDAFWQWWEAQGFCICECEEEETNA